MQIQAHRPCPVTSVSRMPARLKSRMDLMETREEANAGKANPTARLQPNKWGCAVSSLCWGGRRPAVQPRSGQPCAAATALPAVRAHPPGSSSQPDDAPAERQRARPDDPPARTERRRSGRPASSNLFRQLAATSSCCSCTGCQPSASPPLKTAGGGRHCSSLSHMSTKKSLHPRWLACSQTAVAAATLSSQLATGLKQKTGTWMPVEREQATRRRVEQAAGAHRVDAFGGVQGLLSQLHHSVAKGKLEEAEPAAEASARRKGHQIKAGHGASVWVG